MLKRAVDYLIFLFVLVMVIGYPLQVLHYKLGYSWAMSSVGTIAMTVVISALLWLFIVRGAANEASSRSKDEIASGGIQ